MRISDWSSDVCSSDLIDRVAEGVEVELAEILESVDAEAGQGAVERIDRFVRRVLLQRFDVGGVVAAATVGADDRRGAGRGLDAQLVADRVRRRQRDRKSTRLNSSH